MCEEEESIAPPPSPIESEYGYIEPNPPPWAEPPIDRIGELLIP